MMNASRRRALEILGEAGPLTQTGLVLARIQQRTMIALVDAGLARFRPYGKPPSWAIIADGRARLQKAAAGGLPRVSEIS